MAVVRTLILPPVSLLLLFCIGQLVRRWQPKTGKLISNTALLVLLVMSTCAGAWLLVTPLENLERPLLETKNTDRDQIGFIIFLTKTPDYRSPASAIVLQHRLKLSVDCLAYDINLGAVGFLAGLQLGCSLLNGLNTSKGLVIIGDTNSKQTDRANLHSKHLGDAATAILLEKKEASPINVQLFSQGDGYDSYIIPGGAFRTTEVRKEYELSCVPTVGAFSQLVYDWQKRQQFFLNKIPSSMADFLLNSKSLNATYDALVNTLTATGAKGVLANIPYVNTVPFFF